MTHTATHNPRAHTPRLGDDAIQERFAAGDEQALEECQSRFGSLLLANARRVVGANDAEDVVQTVMIEAWQKRHRYDPSRPLEVWLITILRRRAIDHLRKQKTVAVNLDTTGELSSEDGRETAQRFAVASDLRRALQRASQPPARHTRPLVLRRHVSERVGESHRHPARHYQVPHVRRSATPRQPDRNQRARVSPAARCISTSNV